MPKCKVCGKNFELKRNNQVTCSTACSRNRYTPVPRVPITCGNATCGRTFSGVPSRVYCSATCSAAHFRAEYEAGRRYCGRASDPGVSVYLWFDAGAALPYYVGSGLPGRESEPHGALRPPARVEVLLTGLVRGAAEFAESVAILALRACGAPLVNAQLPRTTEPPPEMLRA